ncbi:heterogeneous nuclear ribonucleoprotein U-like protein 2 isoform X1 [Tribolium castaneum]|uniref:SAP domain-containing protein n=1 Tax=Tribolium castaneum TaxID=7070 RepID=A0A139WLP4_TRICA|nr:PREDICTED: heterogeneous nuclear ribonucleoprotein U-like protein 2 isoform X1 [Tribolium castaneum]KYB28804.1 hypothetical protein TcasGA2_TC003021 [Tribolium castaneum]|eukprot:XP_008190822.1 PREDICTED: heterogeneous nuclear ribonucleoprotein U-like protein 2 isoform X1 [Tribolium castaneum]
MSSTLDPAKLKVVELRAELSKRGLDSKGNKPALVKRLKEALEEELKQELPDTSIADTSTEDLDTSQTKNDSVTEESKVPDKEPEKTEACPLPPKEQPPVEQPEATTEEKMDTQEAPPAEPVQQPAPEVEAPKPEETEPSEQSEPKELNSNLEENKENGEQDEPKSRKSRWGGSETDGSEAPPKEEVENNQAESTEAPVSENKDGEAKGEKRRRSSPSPDRSQRRRSKSPIKEDEPPIDKDKVQLSWYDSDLHLQVDKESFLSAKPYHEGAFGFAWAGVRATHGVNTGKVCFEVKVTEELKWEDFSKYYDKHRREQHKSSRHKDDDKKKSDESKSKDEQSKDKAESSQENGEKSETTDPDSETKETSVENDSEMKETADSENEDNKKSADENPPEENPQEEPMETEESKEKSDEKDESETKETEPIPTHLFRVGWSLLDTGLQLGEDKFSYGYESSGRFALNKQFEDYGKKFGVGDVVASFLEITEAEIKISYSVNGEMQGDAISVPCSDLPENFVFFPHVLSRNYAFELNLGNKEEAWFSKPEGFEDFEFLANVEEKVAGPARPENRSDCEVILMCGLPAAGKTHWVQEYVQENPEKRYTVLGNTHLLQKMTVSGDELKNKYKGSWNMLLEKLQKCLNKLVEVAALRRRNYIIDQPNVYPSAQRRKLRPFEGFKRRAVVVVVGDEEQAKRQSLQEAQGGKDVPDSTVLDMKANMSLPQKGEWIDEVLYVGLGEEEAKSLVQKYNSQARETIGVQRRFGHRDDRHRWQYRRNDYRGSNYRDRSYHSNRYDRGPPRQGNWHPQRPGGWNRDRRDNRGPPPRDWRNRGNSRDRGSRDSHQGSNYNRNRNQVGRGPGGNWPSSWGGQSQGSWSNQPWSQGSWGQGGWNNQSSQNQWKYGGGSQSYGYSNWNYYGQYPQNWSGTQGQSAGSNTAGANQYGQYSQQDWAQYAQQYAQQGQTTTGSTATQSTPQK